MKKNVNDLKVSGIFQTFHLTYQKLFHFKLYRFYHAMMSKKCALASKNKSKNISIPRIPIKRGFFSGQKKMFNFYYNF